MPTDIKLDQQDGDWLIVEGRVLKATASDFMLDSPARRRGGPSPHRRALVHDSQDGLTLNFAGDYPGGVTVSGNMRVTGDLDLAGVALKSTIAGLQSTLASVKAATGNAGERLEQIETIVGSLVNLIGAVVVPAWRTKIEVEEGDEMGMSVQSAEQLGLVVSFAFERLNPSFDHDDVVSIAPPAGTVLLRGSTVVVTINLEG
jgi:hypothetical protein